MTDNNDQARFEAQLDIIAQETPGIVWSMLVSPALDITVQFMSASMSELMGLEPETIRENPKILLKRLTPKAQASLQRQARKSFDSGEPLRWEGHIRCRLESRWFQIRVVPVPDAETGASLWHGIAIDASHPKAIQDELVDVLIDKALINKKLQHGIEERQRAQEEILRYQERLRDLAKQVARAEENERRRIAMGLHDDVGQLLAALKMKLSSVT
ncbi:MAG: histidine kinase, partial [Myxococcota bacterium]|nr:histidine kinase [Myxococcota bacterium]